jgi:hypothetical protein
MGDDDLSAARPDHLREPIVSGTRFTQDAQMSFDLGDAVAKPAARRRMRPWEVERAKLKSWQRDRRRGDQAPPWLVGEAWPLFAPSLAKLKLILAVEREQKRCGC